MSTQLPGWSTNPDDYEVVDGQLREINPPTTAGEPMPPQTTTPPAATSTPAAKRDYGVYRELTLDLSDPAKLIEQLKSVSKDDAPVVVLARVGTGTGQTPRAGLTAVAQDVEFDGVDLDVIATGVITRFPKVRTKAKRDIELG